MRSARSSASSAAVGWDVSHAHPWVFSLSGAAEINPLLGEHFPVWAAGAHGSVPLSGVAGRDFQDRGVAVAPFALRVTMFPTRIFYVGVEAMWLSFGFPTGSVHPSGVDAGPLAMHLDSFFMLSFGGVAGVSLPVRRFDLSLELLGGVRVIDPHLYFDDQDAATKALGGCWNDANNQQVCGGPRPR